MRRKGGKAMGEKGEGVKKEERREKVGRTPLPSALA